MLVDMNTTGVPCTINHYRDTTGKMIAADYPQDFDNEMARIEQEFEDAIRELETYSPEDEAVFKELSAKLSKKDADKLLGMLRKIDRRVKDHIPFIRSSMEEAVEKTVTHGKAEFAAFVSQGLMQTGLQHLASQAPTLSPGAFPTLGSAKTTIDVETEDPQGE
jgi:hypothetical protein